MGGTSPVTFGDVLRRFRLAAGLTQEELAERAHLSPRAISDLERGARNRPWRDTVQRLTAALRLEPTELDQLQAAARPPGPSASAGIFGDGARSDFPLLRHNLPVQLTSFVGREREQVEIRELLASTRQLTLTGTGGVGKTRLLTEFCRSVDGRVLWGTCPPMGDRGMPVAPLVEVVRALRADPVQRDRIPEPLARLLAQGIDDSAITRLQLFEGVLAMLEDFAGDHPVVLVLEDLHWADALTRDLLAFLAPNLHAQRVLVIGSYRAEDVAPDSPLRRLLAELGRLPHVVRVELPPLDTRQVAEHIRQLTGSAPSQHVVDRVVARTQGNAYFVEELVAAGRLERGEIPSSLRDLLLLRAGALSTSARHTLGVASLAVADIDERLLAAVTGKPINEIRSELREAISRHLLVVTADGARSGMHCCRRRCAARLLTSERSRAPCRLRRHPRGRRGPAQRDRLQC